MEHTSTSYTIIRQPFHPPPLVHHQQECSTGVHCTAASTESSNAALGLCTSQTTLPAQHVHAHTYCWLCSNSTNRHVVWTGNASLEQRIDGFSSHANWNSADHPSKHVVGRDRATQDSQQGKANQIHWAVTMVQQYWHPPILSNPVNVRHDQLMTCNWSSAGCFIHKHMENCFCLNTVHHWG